MTAEGVGWDGKPRTAPEGGTRESGADRHLGDAMAGGGNTGEASSAAADEAGAGGRHGARPDQRKRLAGRRENPAGKSGKAFGEAHKSSKVVEVEGGHKAPGVAENPQWYSQGVGGGVESPQGTNNPGVAEFALESKTPRVTTAGEGVQGDDRRWQGGDEPPPTT